MKKKPINDAIKLAVNNTVNDILSNAPQPSPPAPPAPEGTTENIQMMDSYERFLRRVRYRDDINTPDWPGYVRCGMFDFANFPIKSFVKDGELIDDITYVLEPEFLANCLVRFLKHMGGTQNNKMVHAQSFGLPYDVFVVYDAEVDNYTAMFNTHIINVSEETEIGSEVCMQYPELKLDIARPKWIEIVCHNHDGTIRQERWEGEAARYIMQGAEITKGIPFWKNASELSIKKGIKRRNDIFGSLKFKEEELK